MAAQESDDAQHPLDATLDAVGRLNAEHHARVSRHDRMLGWLIAQLGGPRFSVALALVTVGWLGGNAAARAFGWPAPDPPPFPGASTVASLAALYLVIVILSTQRQDDALARKRELLMLELAVLAETKSAKTIALLEELRRDIPQVAHRVDRQAESLSRPADPHAVIDAMSAARERAQPFG